MLEEKTQIPDFFKDTKAALHFYQTYGFHIQAKVFSDKECTQLIEAAQFLENAKSQSYRPQMMPHRHHEIYLSALRKSKLVNIIQQLVDGKPVGLQTEFFYCRPGTRGFSLHQDNFFVQAPFGSFVSAWIALTDTYKEKGGLIVYPGTHQEGLLPTQKLNVQKDSGQDPNANNEEIIVPEKYKATNMSVSKGSVLFIHGHLVHGSNPNQTNEWRYVLLNTYLREGEPFRAGNYAKREPVVL